MRNFIFILLFSLLFNGCSSKQSNIEAPIVYKTKIEYVYLPCNKKVNSYNQIKTYNYPKEEEYFPRHNFDNNNKLKKQHSKQKKEAKIASSKKKIIKKFKKPKNTKIYAPSKYITRTNKKMDFMVGINNDGSEFIYLEGEFGVDTYKNFLKFIKQTDLNTLEIKINSNGGLVSTAMQIGEYIKENKWNTGVDKEMKCMSACAFVYFAGKKKSLQGEAVIGLHRPYYPNIPDTEKNIRKIKKDYISYWNYIHASKSLYDEMMDVDRNNLFILNKNNINDYVDVEIK
jgi:ATP-dependent protease ClpP protease subunit